MLVVAQRPARRWGVAAALGLPPAAACAPDVAASRLAHPSSPRVDAVLLLVEDDADLAWLRRQAARGRRRRVPIVAVADARRAAGAAALCAAVLPAGDVAVAEVVAALVAATAPAVVIDLDAARTA